MTDTPLERLGELCGIAPRYVDTSGVWHDVPEASRRELITAMGFDCGDDAAVARSIETIEARRWQRRLPPVVVTREGARTFDVSVALPEDERDTALEWTLTLESGQASRGTLEPHRHEPLEQRTIDGRAWQRVTLELGVPDAPGYHRLALRRASSERELLADCLVVGAPAGCYRGPLETSARQWGLTAQLYSLRSQRNWGIGDFTDLYRLVEFAAARGAAFVGLNPLHAPMGEHYESASPYAPSSRRFINPLYLDVEAVPDCAESGEASALVDDDNFKARLRSLRAAELVDYAAIADLKLEVLEHAFASFRDRHLKASTERAQAFAAWRRSRPDVEDFATFKAIDEAMRARDADAWGWPAWPESLADRYSEPVAKLADELGERIDFHAWLQWNADQQLDAVAARADELGMPIGIYTDLALSAAPGGADTWVDRDLYIEGAHIGAPPDDFNQAGQDWGLPAWHPDALRAQAYRPFIETLRANMRRSGALRIDHVLGLLRLFLVPAGRTPPEGAYVYYALDELCAILALESQRNACLVIGEDLGTVPDELRAGLARIGALGYRVLFFEKGEDGAFKAPAEFDRDALTVVSTHDLPTLEGFWRAADLRQRTELELFPTPAHREQQIVLRAEDRAKLLVALEKHGFLGDQGQSSERPDSSMTPELARAFHAFLASTDSLLVGVQVEDLLGQVEQMNLPGTVDEHPNWRRRLSLALEDWSNDDALGALIESVRARRSGPAHPSPASKAPARQEAARPHAVIPRATYRVQLNREFTFRQLTAIVPYLARLGVSHVYCSPYLTARPGSLHGYDIVDHGSLNPEIGSPEDFEALTVALDEHGMGQILDMVPNHMAVMGCDNAWWLDVLENGQASRHADYFDIDWQPLKRALQGKVLLPILGDHYGNVLDKGELELVFDAEHGALRIDYYSHKFPIDPGEYARVLGHGLESLRQRLEDTDPADALVELESLITAFSKLPHRDRADEQSRTERARDAGLLKRRLAKLAAESSDVRQHLTESLTAYNGDEHHPADVARLHALLEAQPYRLAFWRVAADEINYRRFFDINELASLRMENGEVFEAVHALVLGLIAEGKIDGLRIDHPDGLFDPRGYFRALQRHAGGLGLGEAAPDTSQVLDTDPGDSLPLYVLVEKILAHGETLREDWPVHGTTGYEFGNLIDRLLVDTRGMATLTAAYEDFIGLTADYDDILYRAKRLIMQTSLASELNVLTADLERLAERDPHTRDYGLGGLRNALLETIACFPVYRTYIVGNERSAADEAVVDQAIDAARARSGAADRSVFDFLRDVLLGRSAAGRNETLAQEVAAFGMRMQQYTSPVAAKGMEDTAFYRYARLVSLNEVGGTPEAPAATVADFHAENEARCARWPHAMLASSTHDAKRSEDVRARIHVLSELPDEWRSRTAAWRDLNEPLKTRGPDGRPWPDRNSEYFLYQTLVGAWPREGAGDEAFADRISTYMVKAAREAKLHTSWIHPDEFYEDTLVSFTRALLDRDRSPAFLEDFEPFAARVARLGLMNSAIALVLKLTSPGVPDIYQGNELWRFDLVDPDNRRPVDYARRERLLGELEQRAARRELESLTDEILRDATDDRLKLFLTWRTLTLRRERPALFEHGDYRALSASGEKAEHIVAFTREWQDTTLVVAALRHCASLCDGEARFDAARLGETRVEFPTDITLHDSFSARQVQTTAGHTQIPAAELFAKMPVAVLLAQSDA